MSNEKNEKDDKIKHLETRTKRLNKAIFLYKQKVKKIEEALQIMTNRRNALAEELNIFKRQVPDILHENIKGIKLNPKEKGIIWITTKDDRMLTKTAYAQMRHVVNEFFPEIKGIVLSPDVDIKTLSDEDLKNIGLKRLNDTD